MADKTVFINFIFLFLHWIVIKNTKDITVEWFFHPSWIIYDKNEIILERRGTMIVKNNVIIRTEGQDILKIFDN